MDPRTVTPPPPPGFEIVPPAPAAAPPPPPGFELVAPAAAQPAAEPGMLDTIMGWGEAGLEGAGYLGQELARGVTQLAGAPVDLVNASPMLLNILPGEQGMTPFSDDPVGGSEFLWDALNIPRDTVQEAAGLPVGDAQPQNEAMRFAGRVANEVGAAAVPVGAGLAAGQRLGVEGARRLQSSAQPLTRAAGNYAERFAVAPAATAGKEMSYAAGAGVGGATGLMLASDGDPNTTTGTEAAADLIGSIFGAGSVGLTGELARSGKNAYGAITGSPTYVDKAARDAAAATILQNSGLEPNMHGVVDAAPLASAVRNGGRISEAVPGFADTLADRTQNPGIASLEYGRQSGPNAGRFAQRRRDNANAADAAIAEFAPQSTPSTFRTALGRGTVDEMDRLQTELFVAEDAFEKASTNLDAVMSGEARGQTIRAALDDALGKAREVERAAWGAVQGEVDPAPLASAFDEIYGSLTLSERRVVNEARAAIDTPDQLTPDAPTGPQPSSVLDPYGRPVMREPTPVSQMQDLGEITTLRSEFTAAQRQAKAAGDPNRARILGRFVDAIDMYLDGMPEIAVPLEEARAVSRDLNDRFTRMGTPIADALATRPSGGPTLPDSSVAPRFVQPDEKQASNIDRLLTETGDNADVRSALRDQIVADVRRQGLLDKPDQLQEYLGQYEAVFQKFPELREQLGEAGALRREVDSAKTLFDEAEATIAPGGSGPAGQYARFGAEDPLNSMRTVVSSDRPDEAVRELLRVAGDTPENRESLRAAFWTALEAKAKPVTMSNRGPGGEDPWNFTRLYRTLEDPKYAAAAAELYKDNPEHLANLRELAETLRGADFRVTGRAPGSSGTPQAIAGRGVLPSTETLGAYSFAYQRGQIGLPYIGLRIGASMARNALKTGRTELYDKVLDRALLDPDWAAMLLDEFNPATAEVMSRYARAWLGAEANDLALLLNPDEDGEDDLTNTIMEER